MSRTPGAFHAPAAVPFWRIYRRISTGALQRLAVRREDPHIGVTEHPLNDRERIVVLVNYSPRPAAPALSLVEGWKIERLLYGDTASIPACDACVLVVSR